MVYRDRDLSQSQCSQSFINPSCQVSVAAKCCYQRSDIHGRVKLAAAVRTHFYQDEVDSLFPDSKVDHPPLCIHQLQLLSSSDFSKDSLQSKRLSISSMQGIRNFVRFLCALNLSIVLAFKWHLNEALPTQKYFTFSERYMFADREGPLFLDKGPSFIKVDMDVTV